MHLHLFNIRLMPAGQILFASFALPYSFGILWQKKVFKNARSKKGNWMVSHCEIWV